MPGEFSDAIKKKVNEWRATGYEGSYRETKNILRYAYARGYLHQPQLEALETYAYLKEIVGNKTFPEVYKASFTDVKELLLSLGLSQAEIIDVALATDRDSYISKLLAAQVGSVDYPNQVYALTMGAGKTILMGSMVLYDFVVSFFHQDDVRFAKNALIFAPDTTIIESLKEIKTFPYERVLPKEYQEVVLNIKYHYLESPDTPLEPIGNFNIIVSNSQKIILRSHREKNPTSALFRDVKALERKEKENRRLQAIRQLERLSVFVDEAHHSYGTNLEGSLKKTRETINYIHEQGKTPLVTVVNLTGTPYVNNRLLPDVVYQFGLREGIEQGILKQVRFITYGNVKDDSFLELVIDTFLSEYQEPNLEGRTPKIAIYAASIGELQETLRPLIELILISRGLATDTVLEYHTGKEENKDDFLALDTPQSRYQFILLVGKGTEGWNCRSLVACAMYRNPGSNIFILQASTRCMRRIGDSSVVARIFLSESNAKVLERELEKNYKTSISELSGQEREYSEHTIRAIKHKRVKVKKRVKRIIALQKQNSGSLRLDWNNFESEKYEPFIREVGIILNPSRSAEMRKLAPTVIKKNVRHLTFYDVVFLLHRRTHLSCSLISKVLDNSGLTREKIVSIINENVGTLPFLYDSLLSSVYQYEVDDSGIQEQELELCNFVAYNTLVEKSHEALVLYRDPKNDGRLGFHINPCVFDSKDEKDLFTTLRNSLEGDESITDIYFTGGINDPTKNQFCFEYFNPRKQSLSLYFPDFLIETNRGRYLVVEVKASSEKPDYDFNRSLYSGRREEISNEVFAKEVGFRDFQELNTNFDYHIVFDEASAIQKARLFETLKG